MSSHPPSSLEAGLAALKAEDYSSAIQTLEAVVNKEGSNPAGLQAQIGLVVAYSRLGNLTQAIALCETLTQSSNSQAKQWADGTLKKLITRHQRANPPQKDVTGFVPLENVSPPQTPAKPQTESNPPKPVETPATSSTDSSPPQKTASNPIPPGNPPARKVPGINWQHAPRAKIWQPLQPISLIPLRLLAVFTFIALFWVIRELLKWGMGFINHILVKLPFVNPLQFLYNDPTNFLVVLLLFAIIISPWLLDFLLGKWYGQRQFDKDALNTHSHEAIRVLHRYSQQQGWGFPQLRILPISAPILLSYGNLPRTARIVVSQGLLEQLADDEIAVIYATQLGHIRHWDVGIMSLVLVVTIPTYKLYQQLSSWGNRISFRFGQSIVAAIASLVYIIWCFFTGTALWLSQLRLYYSDHLACSITGNPNALTRALLKIAMGIAKDIEKQEHTTWQLESLNILMPVGFGQSICLGSIINYVGVESFLMWDYLNPYRYWFSINNTHPLMGDRIQRICKIARHWHLDTEINIESQQSLKLKPQSFLLYIAPWLGIPLGLAFAFLMWLGWQTAFALKLLNLKWIYDDWSFVIGFLLIGISIGTLIRINFFFPDIQSATVQTESRLPDLVTNPASLPINSTSVRLVGTLVGRRGTSNALGQDLILHSGKGLVKLHHVSWLGQSLPPQAWIGRQITVTGWLRRGATPWIDIQTLKTQAGKTINSPHPIWSTVLAVAATAWGSYLLLKS
ncbi:MAG: M48 family metalloprotease [Nostocaceae cyanobacterium]|nr:M48 family metalloprotease [Nostocaceae cyanobacterium]